MGFKKVGLIWFLFAFAAGSTSAQNLAKVFSPDVKSGQSQVELRVAQNLETERTAHRFHYQHAFSDSWRMRVMWVSKGEEFDDLKWNNLRWEGQWQFREDEVHAWDSSVRFEIQLAEAEDSPSRLRVAWAGDRKLCDRWSLRGNFLVGQEVGEHRRDGLLLELRGQVACKANDKLTVGMNWFGKLNRSTELGKYHDQRHELGLVAKWKVMTDWAINAQGLVGISKAAQSRGMRLGVSRSW